MPNSSLIEGYCCQALAPCNPRLTGLKFAHDPPVPPVQLTEGMRCAVSSLSMDACDDYDAPLAAHPIRANQAQPPFTLALLNFVGWAADVCLLFRHGLHIERVGGPVLRFRGLCEERQDKTKLLQWRDRLGLLNPFPFPVEVPGCSQLGSLILTTGTAPGVRPAGVLGGKVAALGNFRYVRVFDRASACYRSRCGIRAGYHDRIRESA